MSPQFVDFDGDGTTDILAGTFSGSPWIASGSVKGWSPPVQIRDKNGDQILLNQFWNYETKKWDSTKRCDTPGLELEEGHSTSAWAVDFDQDGDLDLLLGDYETGQLFLRRNDGSANSPAFATKNERVEAAGKPIDVGKIATMRVLDWDHDGHADLLIGSMGESWGEGPGGGVWLFPGTGNGNRGDMTFGAPRTLIAVEAKSGHAPRRPDAGLYIDAADHEGDGDLDLIVGGYSMWTPEARELTAAEEQMAATLAKRKQTLMGQSRKLNERLSQVGADLEEAERAAARKELLKSQSKLRREISEKLRECTAQLNKLVPSPQRKAFVWLYENVTPPATPGGQR